MAGRRLRVTLASHEALDQYMRFRDLSNAQLATKVGVSTATIAHLRRPRGRKTCDPALAPKIEKALNAAGIWHFDQIAGWSVAELAWVDDAVPGVRGRASRDDWVGQAGRLAQAATAGG